MIKLFGVSKWQAAALVLPLLMTATQAMGQQAQSPSPSPSPFAGSEACQLCHEDLSNAFARNPHHISKPVQKPSKKVAALQEHGCESCHGPALKHTETADAHEIRNPRKLAGAAADKICLSCHLNDATHAGRLESSHAKNQVACTSCHKIHANGPFGLVARQPAAINQQCAGCHLNVLAQFQKPNHHKVPEGAMSCVDCHNPHGSARPAMTQSFGANEPGCLNCHADKRGPFTVEHAPVRFDGCTACHEPHGSANPRMLTRPQVRMVCLECHANPPGVQNTNSALGVVPPAFHNLLSPRYQNCTVCHQKVHGSYVDRNLLK